LGRCSCWVCTLGWATGVFKFGCSSRGVQVRCCYLLVSIFRWSKPPHHVKVNPLGEVFEFIHQHAILSKIGRWHMFCCVSNEVRFVPGCIQEHLRGLLKMSRDFIIKIPDDRPSNKARSYYSLPHASTNRKNMIHSVILVLGSRQKINFGSIRCKRNNRLVVVLFMESFEGIKSCLCVGSSFC
jgi:hypothetical protein